KPFAVLIKPAHGEYTLTDLRHQIERQRPARRVVVRTQVTARLVYQPIDMLLRPDRFTVDFKFLLGTDSCHQLLRVPAVNAHAACQDQPLAMAPRAEPGVGKIFVQTIHAHPPKDSFRTCNCCLVYCKVSCTCCICARRAAISCCACRKSFSNLAT